MKTNKRFIPYLNEIIIRNISSLVKNYLNSDYLTIKIE